MLQIYLTHDSGCNIPHKWKKKKKTPLNQPNFWYGTQKHFLKAAAVAFFFFFFLTHNKPSAVPRLHPAQLEITVVENCPSKTSAVNLGLKEQELLSIDLWHQLFDALAVDGQVNGRRHSEINFSACVSLSRRTRAQLFFPSRVAVMFLLLVWYRHGHCCRPYSILPAWACSLLGFWKAFCVL